jgi:predicted O-linked N-acetylglucosamine transferase (SPINDLY family)
MTQDDPETTRVVTLPEAIREAMALQDAGRLGEAKAIFEAVLANTPDNAVVLHQLGLIAAAQGDLPSAIRRMSEAVEANPALVEAYSNLGTFLLDHGDPARAAEAYRAALTIDPGLARAHRNLLQCLLYLPGLDPDARFAEHLRFGARHDPPREGVLPPPPNDRDPARRLRIGVLSSDLCNHPIADNLLPLFEHHDPAAVALVVYDHGGRNDAKTERFRSHAEAWRAIVGLDDRAVAEQVRADAIDIFVVVAARFDRNRPLIAGHRPAPIQVSLFDGATSGMAAFDHWVGDPVVTPIDGGERFSEQVVRVPLLCCYAPPAELPPIGPLPARTNGFVTFGCLARPAKLSDAAIALWASLLDALPDSRLALKHRNRYADPILRSQMRVRFAAHGIAPQRITFLPPALDYLACHDMIDMVLDTMPFSGVTTTFDALTMGVPVIARAGDTAMSRMSATVLTAAGLDALVTASDAAFVKIASGLAGDLDRLGALRAGLRAQVLASPLCDGPAFTRSLEALWRTLWRDWCARA